MNIDYMRYFIAISQSNSLSQAAEKLYMSQQGLTKAVTSMEAETGTQLLERSHSGVRLTQAGKAFAECAERVIEDYDRTLSQMSEGYGPDTWSSLEHVKVLITPYVLETLMNTIAVRFPGSVHELSFNDIMLHLVEPSCTDIALVDIFMPEDHADKPAHPKLSEDEFNIEPLLSTKLGLLVPSDNELAKRRLVSVDEATQQPLAIVNDETIRGIMRLVFGTDALPHVVQEARSIQLLVDQVQKRRTPGLLDSFAFWLLKDKHLLADDISFVPLDCTAVDVVCAVFRRNTSLSPALARFAIHVKKSLHAYAGRYLKATSLEQLQGPSHLNPNHLSPNQS